MTAVKDSFLDLERHRLQLEDSIKSLRKALQHWQTWDAEYEALKEEVDAVPESQQSQELQRICDAFEGELLQPKEIKEIFGESYSRSPEQIRNVLERRIDYVTKNIETLQKQLETAQNKHAAATVVSQPDTTDEDGAPIMDIVEELDDDDNILSYRLNKPGDSMPQVREALEKAGAMDSKDVAPHPDIPSEKAALELESQSRGATAPDALTTSSASAAQASIPRKTVSFVEDDVQDNDADGDTVPPPVSRAARRVDNIMKTAHEQESISQQTPVIPEDEDPDDAALRREMLKYSMGEVGAVVAELQLEEAASDEDDGWDYMNEDDDDEEDEEEDQWGRSKTSVITDDYRQRMLELEKKLGIKSRLAEESAEPENDSASEDERIGRIVVKPQPTEPASASKPAPSKSAMKTEVQEKKGVRFAQELDIAPEQETVQSAPAKPSSTISEAQVEPLSDIVERLGPSKAAAEAKTDRKPSRFKKTRGDQSTGPGLPKGPLDAPAQFLNEQSDATPTGPEGLTISEKLVERDTISKPFLPDDMDDSMLQSEVAGEYQRMRRKFIQREGGFLKEDGPPEVPLNESEGGPEHVSRFKAARHSRQ